MKIGNTPNFAEINPFIPRTNRVNEALRDTLHMLPETDTIMANEMYSNFIRLIPIRGRFNIWI